MSEAPPLREQVELPGRGRLEVRIDEDRVVFEPGDGSPRCFDAHPIAREPGRLVRAAAPDGCSALLARHVSDRLYFFDAMRARLVAVPGFERLRCAEEMRLHVVAGGYLAITENGVACLDGRGRTRWRIEGVTHGYELLAEDGAVLWLRDGAGNVLGIEAATGRDTVG